jgi:hypothetical protein
VIDLDSLAPDWAWSDWAWSIGTPVEKRVYYYCPLNEITALPLPAESPLPSPLAAGRAEAFAASPPKRRIRRPRLESTVRQVLKAAQAAGVTVAVTIEGDTVTASPARAIAPSEQPGNPASPPESPSRSLFTIRTVPKPKLVL